VGEWGEWRGGEVRGSAGHPGGLAPAARPDPGAGGEGEGGDPDPAGRPPDLPPGGEGEAAGVATQQGQDHRQARPGEQVGQPPPSPLADLFSDCLKLPSFAMRNKEAS